MDEYLVDLLGVKDKDSLHRCLRDTLPLPQWYGNNLDALYDSLTEMNVPFTIRFRNWEEAQDMTGSYFESFRRVLEDVQADLPGFSVIFDESGSQDTEELDSGEIQKAQIELQDDREPEKVINKDPGEEKRTLIITDVHGCYEECRSLLEKMSFDEERDILINLGDTIDRGPAIYETFEFFRDLKERMGERCILIRGNHEQMMLDAAAEGGRNRDLWYYNSGEKTVFAFLHHKHRYQEFLPWYEAMPYYYETEKYSCVHACLKDPDPSANTIETLIWGRDTDYSGKLVMTGHTPYRFPFYFQGDQYGRIQEDVWTFLPETGMIALDTGCVYGNRLTGMIIVDSRKFLVTSVDSGVKK